MGCRNLKAILFFTLIGITDYDKTITELTEILTNNMNLNTK